jgi:hypothetical protein
VAVNDLAIDMYSKDTPVTISPNQDSRSSCKSNEKLRQDWWGERVDNEAHARLAPVADLSSDCLKPGCRLKAARLKQALCPSRRRHHHCRHTIAYALLERCHGLYNI